MYKFDHTKRRMSQLKVGSLVFEVRARPLYSMVDGSQLGFFWLVEKKMNKICLQVHVEGKKKIKGEFHEYY